MFRAMSVPLNIFAYIRNLDDSSVNRLYGSANSTCPKSAPWTCRAVLQSLNPVARSFVMRLLFVEEAISLSDVKEWFQDVDVLPGIVEELERLRIVFKKGDAQFVVNTNFTRSLIKNLHQSNTPWSEITKPDAYQPSLEQLDRFSLDRWNKVLHYLVTADNSLNVSTTATSFLVESGLMKRSDTQVASITSRGYEYMLLDIQSQVWLFIYECLKRAAHVQDEVIAFLCMLSYCEFGKCYAMQDLTSVQKQLVLEFTELGIIYQRNPASSRFYPTKIAINIIFKPEASTLAATEDMALIVETNFQVVAYSSSPLHLAMLNLFVDMENMIRMPNITIGFLTRQSIKNAYKLGITSKQLIDFLLTHIHPKLRHKDNPLPPNITDQLMIWENENRRITATEAVYLNITDFTTEETMDAMFEMIKTHADRLGACLWCDDAKKCLVLTPAGYQELSRLLR